jgi:hypothetical protein
MSNNYSMIHNAFVSPLRGATAAVPHNKRDMSSSPYLPKKKSEVTFPTNLNDLSFIEYANSKRSE